jgi:hypothetical protein
MKPAKNLLERLSCVARALGRELDDTAARLFFKSKGIEDAMPEYVHYRDNRKEQVKLFDDLRRLRVRHDLRETKTAASEKEYLGEKAVRVAIRFLEAFVDGPLHSDEIPGFGGHGEAERRAIVQDSSQVYQRECEVSEEAARTMRKNPDVPRDSKTVVQE